MQNLRPPSLSIITIFFFSFTLVSSEAFDGFGGLNFEPCLANSDCKGNRVCATLESRKVVLCRSTSTNCFCRPATLPSCTSSSGCDEGELCYNIISRSTCRSCAQAATLYPGIGDLVDDFSRCAGLGVTGDYCKSAEVCASPRRCADASNLALTCSFGKNTCVCYSPLTTCTSCEDCPTSRESCFTSKTTSRSSCLSESSFRFSSSYTRRGGICTPGPSRPTTSTSALPEDASPVPSVDVPASTPSSLPVSDSPSPFPTVEGPSDSAVPPPLSPNPSSFPAQSSTPPLSGVLPPPAPPAIQSPAPSPIAPPCIAVQHLTHLSHSDLVFGAHRLASVLCDAFGSCATAGHIVVFNGRAMRMRRYCTLQDVQCVQRRMHVNNPRMRRGRRVESMTKGLEFSVFAARYESWAEETIMRAVIAVGM